MRRPFYKTKGKANGKERRTRPHLATEANSFSQNQRASGHCNKNGTSRVEVNKNGDSSEPKAEAQAIQQFKMESQANPRPYTYIIYIYTYYLIIKSYLGGTPICPHWSSIFAARLVQIGQTMRICSQGLVNISENITCTTLAEGLGRWLALCGLQVTFEHREKRKKTSARCDFLKFKVPQNCQTFCFISFTFYWEGTQWYTPHIKLPSCHTSLNKK